MSLRTLALWSAVAASAFVTGKASGSTLYGSGNGGPGPTIYTVDQTTGARTPLMSGDRGFEDLTSDWRPTSYRVWGISNLAVGRSLVQIDPAAGTQTVVGTPAENLRSLAFDPTTDTLFAASRDGLYTLNKTTAIATFVGDGGGGAYPCDALGFDLAGNLFGFSWGNGTPYQVSKIDKTTGNHQKLGSTGLSNAVWVTDLAVRPEDGVLIACGDIIFGQNRLYEVNTTTGALTPIGNTSNTPMEGLAFSPALPEPSTIAILAIALPMSQVRRRSAPRL